MRRRGDVFNTIAIGNGAGCRATGSLNIIIGHWAGNGLLHGNKNVIIGDWIAGKDEDNQFLISSSLPTLMNSHAFLLHYDEILKVINPESYPHLSRAQFGLIYLTLRRLKAKYQDILRHEPVVTKWIPTILCQEILPHYEQHPLFTDWVKHEIVPFLGLTELDHRHSLNAGRT